MGEYDKVEKNICCFIENAGTSELKERESRSRENLKKSLIQEGQCEKICRGDSEVVKYDKIKVVTDKYFSL